MNRDILSGRWRQLRGKIRTTWGKLSKDHMDRIQGNVEMLIGKLQEAYGRSREEIRKELNHWLALRRGRSRRRKAA